MDSEVKESLQEMMQRASIAATAEGMEGSGNLWPEDVGKGAHKKPRDEPKTKAAHKLKRKKSKVASMTPKSEEDWSAFSQAVKGAIYGDTSGHPVHNSADYFKAAQNYAVHGRHFTDFPQDHSAQQLKGSSLAAAAPAMEPTSLKSSRFSKFFAKDGASTSAHYQSPKCEQPHPKARASRDSAAAAGSTAHSCSVRQKPIYVPPAVAPQHLLHNQHFFRGNRGTRYLSGAGAPSALFGATNVSYEHQILPQLFLQPIPQPFPARAGMRQQPWIVGLRIADNSRWEQDPINNPPSSDMASATDNTEK